MKPEDFAYAVQTGKSVDEATVSVLKAAEKSGWSIFSIYDVRERLAAKGFQQRPLKIVELCSAKYANHFLERNRLVSLCMPCKINILEEKDGVKIVGMRPSAVAYFFPEVNEKDAKDAETELIAIIDQAKE
ncbi:MAG TPA: DUF302 domain-containing protein [Candidatus Norongarragalinales archaeon]|nr:DUF302 domain-containing protein [Candidatus Norongarragalinales archaeon]